MVSVDNLDPMVEARKTLDGGESTTHTHIVIAAYQKDDLYYFT